VRGASAGFAARFSRAGVLVERPSDLAISKALASGDLEIACIE
jgi:hypothetical protein